MSSMTEAPGTGTPPVPADDDAELRQYLATVLARLARIEEALAASHRGNR